MSAERLFVAIGLLTAVLFTFITPPFQVPDEVGHFWRAVTIARGTIFPRMEREGAVAEVEQGFSTIVLVFWRPTAGAEHVKITWPQFRTSKYVRLEPEKLASVTFPAGYTPAPYLPQIAAVLLTRLIPVRPVITFYLGRLINAIVYIVIIALAIRLTPMLRWLFAASALLPMALYLAASWSPDAMTIAASYLFIAALLRGARGPRDVALLAAAGMFVGLCKPGYFLIALMALAIPAVRGRTRAIIIAAAAAGFALAMWNAARGFAPVRQDARVDPAAQISCIRHDPARFAEALANEMRMRGFDYVSQTVGRLGLLDVWLPSAVVGAELLLLLLCAWSGAVTIPGGVRIVAAIAALLAIGGIALSTYIGWTPPCAHVIDGLQGRYLLPILPLLFLVIGAPLVRRERIAGVALVGVAAVANGVALAAVALRYYW